MNGPNIELESTRSVAEGYLSSMRHFWGWEIPVYLFLGGVVCGLMMTIGVTLYRLGERGVGNRMRLLLLASPVLLSLGMGALFLDLTNKPNVLRFYGTLRVTAPMSLGSWLLLLVYPLLLALIIVAPPAAVTRVLDTRPSLERAFGQAQALLRPRLRTLAIATVGAGALLGLYTGVLLSATVARPLWSSSVLPLLFLTSGASTGVALLMMADADTESHALAKVDVALLSLELGLLSLWLFGLLMQGPVYHGAAGLLLWGSYSPLFLGVVVLGGIIVPLALEALSIRGRALHSRAAPALVLVGGFVLRVVIVYAGQQAGFSEV